MEEHSQEDHGPAGLFPPEAHDPDAEVSDPSIEGYIEERRKIKLFLADKMIERAAHVSSFEDLLEPLPQTLPVEDSPFQLESRTYRDQMERRIKQAWR